MKFKDFLLDFVNDDLLLITIPEYFNIIDLNDMDIQKEQFIFTFDKEKSKKIKINNIIKINVKNTKFENLNLKKTQVFVLDIEEIKKRKEGIFFLFEKEFGRKE